MFEKQSADKICSKKDKGIKVSPPVPNRVKDPYDKKSTRVTQFFFEKRKIEKKKTLENCF